VNLCTGDLGATLLQLAGTVTLGGGRGDELPTAAESVTIL
jgi:hypothetical protein